VSCFASGCAATTLVVGDGVGVALGGPDAVCVGLGFPTTDGVTTIDTVGRGVLDDRVTV
jgi:hypothetical protein